MTIPRLFYLHSHNEELEYYVHVLASVCHIEAAWQLIVQCRNTSKLHGSVWNLLQIFYIAKWSCATVSLGHSWVEYGQVLVNRMCECSSRSTPGGEYD
jgi:hypothetical protein